MQLQIASLPDLEMLDAGCQNVKDARLLTDENDHEPQNQNFMEAQPHARESNTRVIRSWQQCRGQGAGRAKPIHQHH